MYNPSPLYTAAPLALHTSGRQLSVTELQLAADAGVCPVHVAIVESINLETTSGEFYISQI